MKNFLKNKWRYLIIIAVILLLIITVIRLFIINNTVSIKDAFSNESVLARVCYAMQILTSTAIIPGGIIGVWQYTLTAKAERVKMDVERVQRAITLAAYYKDHILKKYAIIQFVFTDSGLMNIINHIDKEKIQIFDEVELNHLLTKDDIANIEKIRKSNKLMEAIIKADEIYNLNLDKNNFLFFTQNGSTNEETAVIKHFAILQKFMGNIVSETLNNLEFFAMHFSHGTADESVVYQSLHQTYLSMIYVLYYNIAKSNKMDASKFYTNIIELYKKWYERDLNDKKQKIDNARNYSMKGTTINSI